MVNGTPKRRPWLLIVLVASIGLNLFLGSWMLGRWFSGPPMPAAHGDDRRARRRRAGTVDDAAHGGQHSGRAPRGVRSRDGQAPRPDCRSRGAGARCRAARSATRSSRSRSTAQRSTPHSRRCATRNEALQSATQAAIAEAAASLPPDARRQLADWRAHGRGRSPDASAARRRSSPGIRGASSGRCGTRRASGW